MKSLSRRRRLCGLYLHKSLVALATAVVLLFSASDGARAQEASVIAGDPPVETGLKMDRTGISPSQVTQDGQTYKTWVSRQKSVPADEWARSFLFTFTDDRFKNGKTPAVDVEVTFWHEGNTAVNLVADTAKGSTKVGAGWGNQKKLQTLKVRIPDAHFGARQHGNTAKSLPSDGYDLRLNAWAGDFHLRSIRVMAVDPNAIADWTPFLSLSAGKSAQGWVLEPGGSDDISFDLKNSAPKAVAGTVRWDVVNLGGNVLRTSTSTFEAPAGGSAALVYKVDTGGLSADEYGVRLSVFLADGNPDKPLIARERSFMVADKEDVFILFDKEPITRGMDFVRDGMKPVEVEVNGVRRWIWVGNAKFGADAWWNSIKLRVTDPRFTTGNRPVTDVRFTFRHRANAPVSFTGTSLTGPRQIMTNWGNNPNWISSSTHFDDAAWGHGQPGGDPKALMPGEADLRFNANSGAAELRSVRVRGYDLDVPNWTRLLRFDGLDAGRERFIFRPGEKQDIGMKLFNLSNLPFPANATVRLRDDMAKPLWSRTQKATLPPRAAQTVPVAFDTKDMKQGVYLLGLQLRAGETGDALLERDVNLMVSETSAVPRAKAGEFLYGLDTGGTWRDQWAHDWAKFMGGDVIRSSNASAADMEKAMGRFRESGLQVMHMPDPKWFANPDERKRRIAEMARMAADTARRFPEIIYYEVGNEPDLTFFYGGPMSAYVEDYVQIYDAIKATNPNAIVMNGGLSFAGPDGDRRSREFVRLVPKDKIDAFAYHAHGPGASSERSALERIRVVAKSVGKDDKPFIETESGVAATSLTQQRIQARTAVQKLVYGQSEGVPLFHWFRIYITGGDGGYTSIKNHQEPRPVVLSYRTTVKTLRGHRFARKLDISADYEAYLFVENGPNGNDNRSTGRGRVIVAWANARAGGRRLLNLGTAENLRRIDMFGNAEAGEKTSGIVGLTVEADPVFLAWQSDAPIDGVQVMPSPLEVSPTVYVLPGGQDLAEVRIRNTTQTTLTATLKSTVPAGGAVRVVLTSVPVSVAPGATQTIKVPLQVAAPKPEITWPRRWTAFVNLPTDKVDPKRYTTVPGTIEANGQTFGPRVAVASENRIDIAALAGGFGEKREALLFSEVVAPQAMTVRVGASADWWMEWFVNGHLVYSTIAAGNGGAQAITSHQFDLPLRAGRNLLAVRVLSGSQGWKLFSGGPRELSEAIGSPGGEATDRISFTLQSAGGEPLALESSRIEYLSSLLLPPAPWNTPAAYAGRAPQGEVGDAGVLNPFSIEPDSKRWWQGAADLSGRVWVTGDAQHVYVAAAVRDDVHRPAAGLPAATGDWANGDALRVAFASSNNALDVALSSDGKSLGMRREGNWTALTPAQGALEVQRTEGETWYFARFNATLLPGRRFAFNAIALDDDWGVRKQWAPLADAFDKGLGVSLQNRNDADWPRFTLK